MKRMLKILTAVLCLVLLCTAITGCVSSGLEKPTTSTEPGAGTTVPVPPTNGTTVPATQPTMPSTAPTEPDDGSRTLLLTTQGGMAFVAQQISIYGDAELSQVVTVVHTDENGMASFQTEPGSTCYAEVDYAEGYDTQEIFSVTEPMTHIQLVSQLVDPEYRYYWELGDIVQALEYQDWNGNPYRLADAVAAGKTTIIAYLDSFLVTFIDDTLKNLQTIYETYGDQVDVVLLCHNWVGLDQWLKEFGLTYPVVLLPRQPNWMIYSPLFVVDRYGMLVMLDSQSPMDQATADDIIAYFTTETYQQKLFRDRFQLQEYLENAGSTEEETPEEKVAET